MSVLKNNLTVVLVTFKSKAVIDKCINSIDDDLPIIVVENSNDKYFKDYIEKKFNNVKCYLTNENFGMGKGNNIGINRAKTKYVMVLNPDTILFKNTISELIKNSKSLDFSILAPISHNTEYPNYKEVKNETTNLLQVNYVDGYSMLINKDKFKDGFFDENIFMFLENDDLCKRIREKNENIFVCKKAKINHLGGKSVSAEDDFNLVLSRNWHWMWSRFYYNKKHKNYLIAIVLSIPKLCSSLLRSIVFYIFNKKRSKIYLFRFLGLMNSVLGKKSSQRPNI
tara:strand:+ start:163 stop:1008 length:846 start_codon:yes stop_codon:yes gene_type:complete